MLPTEPSCSCGVIATTPGCLVLREMVGWSWWLTLGMRADAHAVLTVLVSVHEGSPLGELHRCIREGVKVNVHIRTFKGLRGVCTGFLVAFDKFWNMVIMPSSRGWRTSYGLNLCVYLKDLIQQNLQNNFPDELESLHFWATTRKLFVLLFLKAVAFNWGKFSHSSFPGTFLRGTFF